MEFCLWHFIHTLLVAGHRGTAESTLSLIRTVGIYFSLEDQRIVSGVLSSVTRKMMQKRLLGESDVQHGLSESFDVFSLRRRS